MAKLTMDLQQTCEEVEHINAQKEKLSEEFAQSENNFETQIESLSAEKDCLQKK
jgi:hypothetical protein